MSPFEGRLSARWTPVECAAGTVPTAQVAPFLSTARGRVIGCKNEGIEAKSHEGDRGDREASASQGPRSGDLVVVEIGRRGV